MASMGSYSIAPVGLGLMSLTWVDPASFTPDDQAFAVIKAAIDAVPSQHRLLLNAGAFYGPRSDAYANLKLVRRFFEKHPELKERVVINVKGGMVMPEYIAKGLAGLRPSAALDDLRADVRAIREHLGSDSGGLPLHVFEPARRDKNTSVEDTIANLATLQKEGLFEHIALSEVGAATIAEAVKAATKLGTQIASVEVEYSAFLTDIEENGVLDACREHGVPILAYSPVGKGFLGGKLKKREDLPAGDVRLHLDRFSEENFPKNVELADTFASLASAHQPPCTPAQLALAWLVQQGAGTKAPIIPIPGTTNASRAKENMGAQDVKLSKEDLAQLSEKIAAIQPHGGRYNAAMRQHGALFA